MLTSVGDVPTRGHTSPAATGRSRPTRSWGWSAGARRPGKLLCHEAARSSPHLQASESLALSAGISVSASSIHRPAYAPSAGHGSVGALPHAVARGAGARRHRLPPDGHDRRADAREAVSQGRQGQGRGGIKSSQIKCGTLFLMDGTPRAVPADKRQRRARDLLLRPVSFSDALEKKARQKLAAPHGAALVVVADGAGDLEHRLGPLQGGVQHHRLLARRRPAPRPLRVRPGEGDAAQALFEVAER